MLIVGQDKKEIINLDNITEIIVSNNEIVITNDIYKEYGETIGFYATEERAKEVLQEIVNAYSDFNYYKSTVDKEKQKKIGLGIYERYRNLEIYKMPEE